VVFLEASPVIYLIEQPATAGPKVAERVRELLASGERLAVSYLVRMECLVGPLKANDTELLAHYVTFFQSPDLSVLPVSPAVCDRAARVRAEYRFRPLDSLDLAAAVEHGCSRFLTNDAQLKRFADIPVETVS
jgi:predicted nucleic acid-binding protein